MTQSEIPHHFASCKQKSALLSQVMEKLFQKLGNIHLGFFIREVTTGVGAVPVSVCEGCPGAESAAAEIPKLLEAAQADPENTQIFRDLSRNYKIAGDLNAAIWAIQQARQTTNGKTDATLEKLEHSLTTENYENCIRAAEKVVAENPENTEYADYLEKLREAEKAYKLQAIQTLVEKYPNDYNYRYDLGLMLLSSGDVNGAIRELQLAQRSPKNRHLAMLNLGRAFIAGGKFDLAADQLAVAKGEIGLMNDLKKDVIYELASALEKSGKRDDAIAEYKALYMADSTYKDVSEKINAFYK